MRWKGGRRSSNVEDRRGQAMAAGAGGQVVPDSFTHGSSAQRVKWFRIGFDSGDFANCDTLGSG